VEESFLSAAD